MHTSAGSTIFVGTVRQQKMFKNNSCLAEDFAGYAYKHNTAAAGSSKDFEFRMLKITNEQMKKNK